MIYWLCLFIWFWRFVCDSVVRLLIWFCCLLAGGFVCVCFVRIAVCVFV